MSQNDYRTLQIKIRQEFDAELSNNERNCPACDMLTLQGMPGGRDSICENCGYKDPCCYD